MKRFFDVIIVGAGPSGSFLAYELARKNLDVCIMDKDSLPRYKPCGGGVLIKTANLLPFDISEVIERTIYGATVTRNLRSPKSMRYPEPLAYMVMRDRFDYLITEKAMERGAELVQNERIVGLEQGRQTVRVSAASGRTYEGRLIAGADGARSAIARLAGMDLGYRYGMALESEVPIEGKRDRFAWDLMKFDVGGPLPGGYRWVFPKGRCLSVGVGAPVEVGRMLRSSRDEWLAFNKLAGRNSRHSGHLLKLRIDNTPPLCANRVLLVGEAAGLVDGLLGEGLSSALKSALLASRAIASALEKGLAHLDSYREAVERDITPELFSALGLLCASQMMPRLTRSWLISKTWGSFCQLFRGELGYRAWASKPLIRPIMCEPALTVARKRYDRQINAYKQRKKTPSSHS